MTTHLSAIDFTSDIARLTKNFTGRQWVFDDIDRWLKESEERFFILTGEPGVGKSAIAARLTQIRDDIAAYHFCRAGDVETVRPARILRSLAAQLGEHLTDYGQALANTIKPIHLRVEVNITIGSMTGSQVTGVYIENLKESDPENELDILIRAPLEELQKMYAERQQAQPSLAIILIDSLDEAVTTTGTNLVKLLTQLSKSTSLPSWVRFVMTSRPERRVLRGFEPLKPHHLQEKSDESLADVRRYVQDRVDQPALQDRLQVNQIQSQTLISEITNLSHGNFLYTTLLLNDIEAGRQALDNLAALPKSIDDIYHGFLSRFSEEAWSDRSRPIFGVLTVAQEPISEKQISNFTKIDAEDVRDNIRIARQFFDVEIDEQNKETYSIFHQSLRDYLLDENRNSDFWCNERKQHQRIIDFCERTSKFWQELECIDAYGRKYLAQHLVKAEQVEEFYKLLSLEKDGEHAWFKLKNDMGDISSFVSDIELAWLQAEESYDLNPGRSIGLQCRYALIKTSINSFARIPKGLMLALLKYLYWKPDRAFAYACQIPDLKERFETLKGLIDELADSEAIKKQVLQSALETIKAIKEGCFCVEALKALADKLTPELLPIALEAAHAIKDDYNRAQALRELADKLPELLPKALEAAHAIKDDYNRAQALRELADKLPELLPKVLDTSLAIENEEKRGQVLEELADKLAPDLLPKALEAILAFENEGHRAQAMVALAERLPELLPIALEGITEIENEYARVTALGKLANKISPELLSKALEVALAIENSENRVEALAALADKLPEALPNALEAVLTTKKPETRARSLITLADKCPEALPKALDAVLDLENQEWSFDRATGLEALADKLTPELLPKAFEAALNLRNRDCRILALRAFSNKLTPTLFSVVLNVVLDITNDDKHLWDESSFVTHITMPLNSWDYSPFERPVELYERNDIEYSYTLALRAFVDNLPLELLLKALKVSLDIKDTEYRAQALTVLASRLPELLPEALEAATAIQDQEARAQALIALADKLPELLPIALEFTLAIPREEPRAWNLITLANKLSEALPKALEAAININEKLYSRVKMLKVLADKLTPELLLKAVEVAIATPEGDLPYRTEALVALAIELAKLPELQPRALETLLAIPNEWEAYRIQAWISLADEMPKLLTKALEAALALPKEWHFRAQTLTILAGKRPELLPKALEAALAIPDQLQRAQSLMAFTDRLPEVLPKALEAALVFPEDHYSTQSQELKALTQALTSKLTPEMFSKALEAALAIQNRQYRTQTLTVLANKLPEALPKALEAALTIENEKYRAEALTALADKLPEILPKALEMTLAIKNERDRADALTLIADKLPKSLLPEALKAALAIQSENERAKALTALVGKLPQALPKALEAALDIQYEYSHHQALADLVFHLVNHPDRLNLWKGLLHSLSYRARHILLGNIEALTPVLIDLGGESAVAETAQAIQDVSRWWP